MLPYDRKNRLPFPLFEAVAGLLYAPDYLLSNNRKLEFQEDRNLGVYPFGPQAKGWLPLPLREDATHHREDFRCTII